MTSIRKVLIVICLALIAAAAWLPVVNGKADEITQKGLKRTLTTFTVVRSISSVVAVLNSTNIGVLKIGEALHPVIKITDQFLDVMLIASASMAFQLLLLKIGAHWLTSLGLSASLIYCGARLVRGNFGESRVAKICLLLLLVFRFAMPVAVFGTQAIYRFAIEEGETTALADATRLSSAGAGLDIGAADAKTSILDKAKTWMDVPGQVRHLLAQAKDLAESIARLIAGFLLQSVVLPLGFFWAFWLITKAAFANLLQSGHP